MRRLLVILAWVFMGMVILASPILAYRYLAEPISADTVKKDAVILASPAPLPPHGIRSEVLADVVRVRDGFLTPLEEYYHKGEMVTVYRREGNWCWVGENRQIFCGCLSGFNAGLGCEAR